MIPAALALLSGAGRPYLIALAVIAALLGGYALSRQSGRDAERATIATQEHHDEQTASRARGAVDGLGDRAVSERLRQFQRQ